MKLRRIIMSRRRLWRPNRRNPQPLNGREERRQVAKEKEGLVEPLLVEGLRYREIARRLQLSDHHVEQAAARIYRKCGISGRYGRKAFVQRFGAGQKHHTTIR